MYRNNDKAASDNESSASEKSDGQLSDTDDDVFQPSAKRSKQNNGMVVEICQGSKFVSKVRRKKDIWSKVMNSQLQDETIKDLVNTAVEGCRTKERCFNFLTLNSVCFGRRVFFKYLYVRNNFCKTTTGYRKYV